MLDEALEFIGGFGPDLRGGMTSHAPMVAEALCALGRPDALRPWLERHRAEFTPRPPRRERIEPAHWRSALAKEDRFADWSAFFAEELANASFREVLDAWVARLAPGICANATHGVIRVGHAARALGERETPARLRELADALASWASTYQELPTLRASASRALPPRAALPPREALARVELQPRGDRVFSGTIVSSLAGLGGFAAFAPVIGLLDTSREPADLLAELTEVFAHVLLENAHDTLTAIVLVHGVTSVAALGNLLPHIGAATARAAMPFAWQASCSLYVTFGSRRPSEATIESALEPARDDAEALIERAIAHGDEHAIKLAEACFAQHRRRPSPVYPAALRRALTLLQPG
ncbi:MAG: questin oxidase family protein [Myxococcota bacterium]